MKIRSLMAALWAIGFSFFVFTGIALAIEDTTVQVIQNEVTNNKEKTESNNSRIQGLEADLAAEVEAREIGDSDLQSQIDGMGIPLQELSDRVIALEEIPLQIELTGSTFINWGSTSAPEGATLIYSGYGYASHYSHAGGSSKPIVVKTGDPGGYSNATYASLLYFIVTESTNMPPGITANSYIKAAVSYAETPTVIILGTHLPPEGWEVLYFGYAMGASHRDESQLGPICVNSQTFESEISGSSSGAIISANNIDHAAPGDTEIRLSFIKCSVCKKIE
ncbi:MAG: hypothetical protein HF978_01410 [Desulfobacteraceae bacterium]|nr:hypothetical protein [Desulfobacteraceae bacterium]MBC2754187.1 hypothetical protein [Desulfobacteraceae bacterium]